MKTGMQSDTSKENPPVEAASNIDFWKKECDRDFPYLRYTREDEYHHNPEDLYGTEYELHKKLINHQNWRFDMPLYLDVFSKGSWYFKKLDGIQMQRAFIFAVANGDLARVKNLINAIPQYNDVIMSMLRLAIRNEHFSVFKFLLEYTCPNGEGVDTSLLSQVFCDAASSGNLFAVKKLLERFDSFLSVKDMGNMFLVALQKGHLVVVQHLLFKVAQEISDGSCTRLRWDRHSWELFGANTDSQQIDENNIPLCLATILVDIELHLAAIYGDTPLHFAKFGNTAIALADWFGNTPLHTAALHGQVDKIATILEKGADIQATNIHGNTALHCAAFKGHKEALSILLAKNKDMSVDKRVNVDAVNQEGRTPLMLAIIGDHFEIFELLLNNGADINCHADKGTALYYTARYSRLNMMEELLKRGADEQITIKKMLKAQSKNINTNNGGDGTPLQSAIDSVSGNNLLKIVDLFIKYRKERLNFVSCFGGNALREVVCNTYDVQDVYVRENVTVLNKLLDAGINIDCGEDSVWGTPLINCSIWYSDEIFEILLKRGANVNATCSDGKTALHHAASEGEYREDAIALLLEAKADVLIRDDKGNTALHYAMTAEEDLSLKNIKALINAAADVNAKNNLGEIPLDLLLDKMDDLEIEDVIALLSMFLKARVDVSLLKEANREKIVKLIQERPEDFSELPEIFNKKMYSLVELSRKAFLPQFSEFEEKKDDTLRRRMPTELIDLCLMPTRCELERQLLTVYNQAARDGLKINRRIS